MEVEQINLEGKVIGKVKLPECFFQKTASGNGVKLNRHLVHEVIRAYMANQRSGTHSTLTRSEVTGGGRKPWKQKHTGRARAGTSRSPLWRKGGIIFGPKPRCYRIDLPQSKVKSALSQILEMKAEAGEVIVSEKPVLEKVKTKEVVKWMKNLSLPKNSLLVLDKKDENLSRASRNLELFRVMEWRNLHPFHILQAKKVVFTPEVINVSK